MTERMAFSPENVVRREHTISVIELKVPSTSEPGTFHYVSVSATCTCKSFIYRNKCKHIHTILDEIAPRPEIMK